MNIVDEDKQLLDALLTPCSMRFALCLPRPPNEMHKAYFIGVEFSQSEIRKVFHRGAMFTPLNCLQASI
jgi:hypothetical protein